jgi:RNA 2',3'-cyclic 3'-phosphodiesterase
VTGERARTFLALWPPRELQEALASRVGAEIPRSMRAVRAHELHVTLVFLGDVTPAVARDLDVAAAPIVAARPRPALAVRGAGSFGPRGRERLLWAGVEDADHVLQGLQGELSRACAGLGLGVEDREWSPHVTVARAGRGERPRVPAAFYELDFRFSWIPDGVARVVSRPGAEGPERFTIEALHPFGAPGGARSS